MCCSVACCFGFAGVLRDDPETAVAVRTGPRLVLLCDHTICWDLGEVLCSRTLFLAMLEDVPPVGEMMEETKGSAALISRQKK